MYHTYHILVDLFVDKARKILDSDFNWIKDEQLCLRDPSVHKLLLIPPCPLTNTYLKLDFNFYFGFLSSCYNYRIVVFKKHKQGECLEVEIH